MTIVAQAGTLPLTIALFNRFPTYFILTNIIIVPLSSLLVIIGCIIPILYPVKFISYFLAMILNNLTGVTEFLTRQASNLPLSSIENVGMTNVECILLTATIFLFTCFLLNKKSLSVIYPMSALLIFVLAGTVREIDTKSTNELIVYNTPGRSTIGIRTGKILCIFADTASAVAEVRRHSTTLGLRISLNRIAEGCSLVKAGKTKILISNLINRKIMDDFSPDIVILTGSRPGVEFERDEAINSVVPVIAAEGFPQFSSSLRKRHSPPFPVYIVRKSGAFIKRI